MSSIHSDLNFISSICSNFSDIVNESGYLLCGQDTYEILTAVFGDEFSEKDLRHATPDSYKELSNCMSSLLEIEAMPELAKEALEQAIHLWSG